METLGVLLTTAGLAALKLLNSDHVYVERPFTKAECKVSAANMLTASNTCILICDKYYLDVTTHPMIISGLVLDADQSNLPYTRSQTQYINT